jgi:dipeptidase D
LGADNGIAVAMMLALLDDSEISHPPIEAVFTTGEEDALDGANALDCSQLKGRRMINLDSEQEGEFITGCAGGCVTEVRLKLLLMENPCPEQSFKLEVKGLLGGHSGVDIDKARGNANVILGRALNEILPQGVFLGYMEGGTRDNVIPSAANALIFIPKAVESEACAAVEALAAALKREYQSTDPAVTLTLNRLPNAIQSKVFEHKGLSYLSQVLISLPCGVLDMSADIKGIVETSNSVAMVRTNIEKDNATGVIINSTRSSVASRRSFVQARIGAIAALSNADTCVYGHYPGWAYAKKSPLRDLAVTLWHRFSGHDVDVTVTHGGLECGIFVDKLPDLDVISFGPNITDVHSPDESMEIASVERVWLFLIALLKEI